MTVFFTLSPLTLTSFKTRDVTLKYAWFLKMGMLALDLVRTIFIVSKFEYVQCKGGRPIQLKPISRSHLSGMIFSFLIIL